MPNRLERFLEKKGGLVELIVSWIFLFTGATGIAIYISRYVISMIGLQGLTVSVPHSLAFLAIMVVFVFIGMALTMDFLTKTI